MKLEDRRRLAERFPEHGIWAPILSPLNHQFTPDPERLIVHAQKLLADGCRGILLWGSTGEAPSFSIRERMGLLEQLLERGLAPEHLMVGVGCNAWPDTLELAHHALDCGCPRLLVVPPCYYKGISEAGLYRVYAELVEGVASPDLRLYLYHFPKLSGVPIPPAVVARLQTAFPDIIAGIKDSSGDPAHTLEYIRKFPDLAIFPGTESLLLPMLEQGGAGCITANANICVASIRRVYDAWLHGNPDAAPLQQAVTRVRLAIEANPLIPTLKAVVAHSRQDVGWKRMRAPFCDGDIPTKLPSLLKLLSA